MFLEDGRKIKLLELKRILEEQTDEDHCLTATQIRQKLGAIGIPAERKAIYDDIKALNRFYEPADARKHPKPLASNGMRKKVTILITAVSPLPI